MQELEEQLARTMHKIAAEHIEIVSGIATSVDAGKQQFILKREGYPDHPEVLINAAPQAKYDFALIPKEGSAVIVGFLNGSHQGVLLQVGDIAELSCKTGDYLLKINDKGLHISNGKDSLLSLLTQLIKEVQKIIVLQGTSPDLPALILLQKKFEKLLR